MLTIAPTAFAGATTAIGLLTGFRISNSYGRYREGRQIWSDAQSSIRDFARQVKMFIPPENDNNIDTQQRLLRLCQAFPIALMFHLNDKGSHHDMKRFSKFGNRQFYDRVFAEFRAELYDVYHEYPQSIHHNDDGDDDESSSYYNTLYDCSNSATIANDTLRTDFERLCQVKLTQGGNVPLEVLICMSESIATLLKQQQQSTTDAAIINPILIRELDDKVQRLTKVLGGGERLLKTPLPTGFTRHSSRLLFIWSNCLPLALYPVMGPLGTLPTSLLTSYAVLGIEDISVQLEEPFDILPLRQFSNTIYDSVNAIETRFSHNRE
jgi:predicted membrane chloride channel (bestrophin family)